LGAGEGRCSRMAAALNRGGERRLGVRAHRTGAQGTNAGVPDSGADSALRRG
jgi:hypothetical protein